jgi:hypothetical protein
MAADKLHDSGIVLMMSGIGPKPTSQPLSPMSALGGKADLVRPPADVAF